MRHGPMLLMIALMTGSALFKCVTALRTTFYIYHNSMTVPDWLGISRCLDPEECCSRSPGFAGRKLESDPHTRWLLRSHQFLYGLNQFLNHGIVRV